MKYEWLLFDADNTLFDYDKAEAAALASTFEHFQLPFDQEAAAAYRRINGRIWIEFEQGLISQEALRAERFVRLFQFLHIDTDAEDFSAEYLHQLGLGTFLIPGADALLAALNPRCQLLLITNGIPDVQRPRLAASTIQQHFPKIVISGEVGAAKPDPKIFDAAFRLMGWPSREKVLIIGDSISSDIRGGQDYGIDTCWYNPNGRVPAGNVQPTYEIRELQQILVIVGD